MSRIATHTLGVNAEPSDTHDLDECLHSLLELHVELLGIQKTDKSVYEEFCERIRFVGGRYKVSLPWRETPAPLSDDHYLMLRRLEGLLRRLKENPTNL